MIISTHTTQKVWILASISQHDNITIQQLSHFDVLFETKFRPNISTADIYCS